MKIKNSIVREENWKRELLKSIMLSYISDYNEESFCGREMFFFFPYCE